MAITQIGASLESLTAVGGSVARSFTVGAGSDRLLLVAEQTQGAAEVQSTGITYNGISMALARVASRPLINAFAKIWFLIAPPEGTADIVVSYDAGNVVNKGMGAAALAGVHQATPLGNTNAADSSGSSASTNLTTTVNDSIVVDSLILEIIGNPSPGAGQIGVQTVTRAGASYEQAGVAPVSIAMSWSWSGGSNWAHALAEIIPATAVGTDLLLLLNARDGN